MQEAIRFLLPIADRRENSATPDCQGSLFPYSCLGSPQMTRTRLFLLSLLASASVTILCAPHGSAQPGGGVDIGNGEVRSGVSTDTFSLSREQCADLEAQVKDDKELQGIFISDLQKCRAFSEAQGSDTTLGEHDQVHANDVEYEDHGRDGQDRGVVDQERDGGADQ